MHNDNEPPAPGCPILSPWCPEARTYQLPPLDLLERKRLIRDALAADGEVCTLGAVASARDVDVSLVDYEDREAVAHSFGIAEALAAEIAYMNDERFYRATPEERFTRMREWVTSQIKESS
jgi:hypothetical protein